MSLQGTQLSSWPCSLAFLLMAVGSSDVPLFQKSEVGCLLQISYQRYVGSGYSLPKASKQARFVETLLYFRCWQLGRGRDGRCLSKADFHPATGNQQGKSFYRQKAGGGGGRGRVLHAEITSVSSNSRLQIGHQWILTSIILEVVLGAVNFQLRASLSPFLWGPVPGYSLAIVQFKFSTWGFSAYKTAHRIWLRISRIAFEKEPKVLDCA